MFFINATFNIILDKLILNIIFEYFIEIGRFLRFGE